MRFPFRFILMTLALCVCSASLALGASVTISSTGAGSFAVQGDNMSGVSGMDLTIGYDPAVLSAPTVKWGSLVSGAITIANTTTIPGSIRIAIIHTNPFSGSGPIAAITFAAQNGSGGITALSAKLIDPKGSNVPAQTSIAAGAASTAAASAATANPLIATAGVPFSQPAAAGASTTAAAAAAPQGSAGLGTLSLGDFQPKGELPPAETAVGRAPEIVEAAEAVSRPQSQPMAEKGAEAPEPADVKQTVYSGVLDRFRTYQGERTPPIMVALFSKAIAANITQEPAIAVSDGTTLVRLTVDLSAIKGGSPNFALTGAKLVSLNKGAESGLWLLEALPQANAVKASVTILNSNSVMEFPLTIVPPAAVSKNQADFADFLKDSGVNVPKHDLNGDGRHDYLDDYIYTAHYLINTQTAGKK